MASHVVSHASSDPVPFSIRSIAGPLVAIIIGIFMVVLDTTATNVALPTLVKGFRSPLSTIQWVITGYTLAQAAAIPLAGWLSDRFGTKQLFLASVIVFTVFSALCATAQTGGALIAFRILQGVGGGFVIPVGLAYVYRLAPPARVGSVTGLLGVPVLLAPAIGPVLAGWLVQDVSWRWIFLINVPVGVVGVLLGLRWLPLVERAHVAALDIPGIILAPLAFASLVYGISEGSTSWTSVNTLGGIVVGALALITFVVVELRAADPLLELRVFRSADFNIAIVAQWAGQFAFFGVLFLVPLYLQQVRGYGALDTGLTLLPEALATMVILPLGGTLYDRIGARPLVLVGFAIMAMATVLLAMVSATTTGRDLVVPLILYGAGLGLMFLPVITQTLNTAPRELVGRVSALTNALQQVVSSVAVAFLSTLLVSRTTTHVGEARRALAALPGSQHLSRSDVARHAQQLLTGASATAFDDAFHVMLVIMLVGAALGLLIRRAVVATQTDPQAVLADVHQPIASMAT